MSLDEMTRLDELRRYETLDADDDGSLARLAELAARACNAPIGVISFLDETHQHFLARWGTPGSLGDAIPREQSVCAITIEHPESILVVENLAADVRFNHLAIVGHLELAFYAGAPLVTPGGYVLGTLCVVDHRVRTLSPAERQSLELVRDEIMELFEQRRELAELRRSESLRQEAVEALMAAQQDLQRRIDLRTRDVEAAHQKTRTLLDRIGDAYVVLDRTWHYVYVNQRAAQLFGRTPPELVGKHIWTEFPEGVGQPFHLAYERAMREQVAITIEACYEPWKRWFENRIYPSPDGVAIFFTEITDRKRAQAETERIHARLVEAQRVAHVGSWEWDMARDEVVWSDELYRIYGLPLGSPLGGYQGFLSRVDPANLPRTREIIGAAIEQGTPFIYDHYIRRPDGTRRLLHTRGEAIAVDGKVQRLVGCCWDVTELRQATEARERTASLLEATLLLTSDGVLALDAAGRVRVHNAQLAALFGLPAQLDGDALALIAAELVDPAQLTGRAAALAPGQESDDTLALRDGRRVEARSRPHMVEGEVAGRVWSFRLLSPA